MFDRELRAYLAHLSVERGLSGNTISAYSRDLARYRDFLSHRGHVSLQDVSRDDVTDFITALSHGGPDVVALSPASVNRTSAAIRGWHRFAVTEGWASDDPAATVRPRALPRRLPKAIGVGDVEELLRSAAVGDGPRVLRNVALLELLYATGARISEAVGLDVDDVGLEPDAQAVVLSGKGNRQRVVPMGGPASAALNAYLVRARPALAAAGKGTPAVFLNHRGSRLSRQSAWSILTDAAARAGLDHLSPHTLRHSFATHLMDGGADVRVVQELLGHASVATTQVYTLVTQHSLREVYAMSHPRARDRASGGSVGA